MTSREPLVKSFSLKSFFHNFQRGGRNDRSQDPGSGLIEFLNITEVEFIRFSMNP